MSGPGTGGAAAGAVPGAAPGADKGALVQIGHYVLGDTLGIGTFGKVKGILRFAHKNLPHLLLFQLGFTK